MHLAPNPLLGSSPAPARFSYYSFTRDCFKCVPNFGTLLLSELRAESPESISACPSARRVFSLCPRTPRKPLVA